MTLKVILRNWKLVTFEFYYYLLSHSSQFDEESSESEDESSESDEEALPAKSIEEPPKKISQSKYSEIPTRKISRSDMEEKEAARESIITNEAAQEGPLLTIKTEPLQAPKKTSQSKYSETPKKTSQSKYADIPTKKGDVEEKELSFIETLKKTLSSQNLKKENEPEKKDDVEVHLYLIDHVLRSM
jgi:hypothetical protein